jgi:putative peptidoglycan lipid II flippase
MTRAFYATKDTVTPVKLATLSFVINVALGWWLKDHLGARGLAVASTAAVIVQTLLLQRLLGASLPGMQFGELWRSLGKILLATLVMVVPVGIGWRLVAERRGAEWIAVFGLIPLAVGIYAAALHLLKIEGREELDAVWKKVRAKLG